MAKLNKKLLGKKRKVRNSGDKQIAEAINKRTKGQALNLPSVSIGSLAEKNMMDYGSYTIYSRAIPMLYDGMKPVHRRVIYAMDKMGLIYNVAHRKAAKVVGDTMGNYHPHGDAAIYGAMVGLSTGNGTTPLPLIDGQGNWGNFDGVGPFRGAAAPRYTECRMTKYATEMLTSRAYMDSDVIPYVDNYDGSEKEPLYLPSLLPTLFLLGAEGIATGVSINMPAYSYPSVLAATKVLFKTGKGVKAARKLVPIQRWGAELLSSQADLDEYHKTGNGKLEWQAPYEVVREKNNTIIKLSGLPPTSYDTLYKSIMGDEKRAGIKGVYSVIDLTDKKSRATGSVRIEISIRDEAAITPVKKKLNVSESYRAAVTLLVKNDDPEAPLKVGFEPWSPVVILEKWLEWRIELEKRLIKSLVRDNDKELARLRLMILAASKLDIIFSILKAKKGSKVEMIEKQLKVTNEEAKTIWQMAVRQLDALNADDLKANVVRIEAENKKLKTDYKAPNLRILKQIEALPANSPNDKATK